MSNREYSGILSAALNSAKQISMAEPELPAAQVFEKIPAHLKRVIGGDTTCIEVEHEKTRIVIDLGTGSRRLGEHLAAIPGAKEINILITHTHWDHIQGFPFFAPAMDPEVTLNFFSCIPDLETRLSHQQHPHYHFRSFTDLPCKKTFTTVVQGQKFSVGGVVVEAQPLIHPGGSASYKIMTDEKTFVFATDTEFYGPELSMLVRQYDQYFHGAHMLIIDAQYSLTEAEQKRGWGHTAMTIAVDCAMHWGIKKLGLTHHEPSHTDETIRELYARAQDYLGENNPREHQMELLLACEGDEYFL